MLRYFQIIVLFVYGYITAQEKKIETVYFEFDKYDLKEEQKQVIHDFLAKRDTANIESIEIYGYCDDRGSDDYNYKLSINRVNTVRDILVLNGFTRSKIVILEGKGRVVLDDYTIDNLSDVRSKNRRVDLLFIKRNRFGKGLYHSFQEGHKVGDKIFLESVFFKMGSSKLSPESRKELDNIVKLLKKNTNIEFEIRGHVCCTPNYFYDAVDRDTKERKLSYNRARNVYRYLAYRGISGFRMTYKGLGNRYPQGRGEAFDRRVEFFITKI